MVQSTAMPIITAYSTAFLLTTGSTPGMPEQISHTLVLGSLPNSVEQAQNSFELVRSWACTSSPMTTSYSAIQILLGQKHVPAGRPRSAMPFLFCCRTVPDSDLGRCTS